MKEARVMEENQRINQEVKFLEENQRLEQVQMLEQDQGPVLIGHISRNERTFDSIQLKANLNKQMRRGNTSVIPTCR
ncbi:hypothetical protein K1719_038754 [Acacia pycnantha]|nr:hypothetical protein K1719_038754 [Acacia pycnantha]